MEVNMSIFDNLFGYVLNFLYNLVSNYGIAIILFSILIKVLMIPLTIKQQKTLRKNEIMQKEKQFHYYLQFDHIEYLLQQYIHFR